MCSLSLLCLNLRASLAEGDHGLTPTGRRLKLVLVLITFGYIIIVHSAMTVFIVVWDEVVWNILRPVFTILWKIGAIRT